MSALNKAAKMALLDCMALGKEESLLVLTDDQTMKVGMALFEAGRQYAGECILLLMKEREVNGQEPPEAILEDEKVMGTVHIALGNNMSMGGTCDVGIHLDGVMLKPTLKADARVIMQDGTLIIDKM